ncbi:Uncharacterized protein conserved in bacteria [Bordetella ansorpii]|uniref:Uncharacterized protein conserved in bacteria n=1 Tax=Bordetella ansorpii TaxID=288768 RepID=A0A157S5U1_9BORD|nr:DUF2239 family protein [Bordetella ansorpii]SAI65745.1 Uncharacterized protein conserved in bacteria [Bordetella ansorpii]
MPDPLAKPVTAFDGHRLLCAGELVEVALAVKTATDARPASPVLVFDDATGRVIDLDLRGTKADVVKRLSQPVELPRGRYAPREEEAEGAPHDGAQPAPRGRGRPRLGVVSREVTLLPRQWEWLSAQPGGASAVLRRLVDGARRSGTAQQRQQRRAAQEAAYHVMLAVGGNLPGYEEATRALFADDREGLEARIAQWPEDVRAYVLRLAFAPAAPVSA